MKLAWCIAIFIIQIVIGDQFGTIDKDLKNIRRERHCITARGKRGICVPPRICERYTSTGSSSIFKYQCKGDNIKPLVCCFVTRRWFYHRSIRSAGRSALSVEITFIGNSSTTSSNILPPLNATHETSTEIPTTSGVRISSPKSILENCDFASSFPEPPVCGVSQGVFSRVVGGNNASAGDFPWMGLIAYRVPNGFMFKCGASLITSQHSLTAAHCIVGFEDILYFVRLGELDYTEHSKTTPVDAKVKAMIRHEKYNLKDLTDDIGLLVFYSKVIFTDFIRPICLPLSKGLRSNDFVDYRPFVAGWGRTSYKGETATHLQMLQIPVVSQEICSKAYVSLKFIVIDKRVICAGGAAYKDTCNGDSGGPLMQPVMNTINYTTYFYQTGIVSLGMKCGTPGYPGVYTRVSEFIPWIQKQVLGTEPS